MTDLELIYLILAVFYVAKCGHWVRPGALVFAADFGGHCRLRTAHGSAWLRNDHGGLVLGNLLPVGHALLGQHWPLALGPAGIVSSPCQVRTLEEQPAEEPRWLPWEEVRKATADGRLVQINDQPFVRAASAALAGHLAALLTRLASVAPAERAQAIDTALADWWDASAFAVRFRRTRRLAALLLLPCTALFLYVFVAAPLLYHFQHFSTFLDSVPPYLVIWFLIAALHHWIQGRLGASSGECWSGTLGLLISPADAMHAHDQLFRPLATPNHPLAIASVLCTADTWHAYARQQLLDLRFPLPVTRNASYAQEAVATEQWFRARLEVAAEGLLVLAGRDPEDFLPPPTAEQVECRAYCPRCLGQYVHEAGTCSTCALALCSFAAPSPPRPPRPRPVALAPPVPEPPPPVARPPSPVRPARKSSRKSRHKKRK